MPSADQSSEALRHPDVFPSQSARVLLEGPAGDLEALIELPEPEDDCGATAILCQPIADGSTMHNKVLHIMERAFRELGARTVRFNFRGVGESAGEHDRGFGESEDLVAVAQWVNRSRPGDELWLGGYGFGAFVAVRGCQKIAAAQLVTVAPPVDAYDFSALPLPTCPWLVIQGDDDTFTNPEAVYAWVESLPEPPQLLRMEDADHAFHRRLMDLRGAIKNGIKRQQRADDSPE